MLTSPRSAADGMPPSRPARGKRGSVGGQISLVGRASSAQAGGGVQLVISSSYVVAV